MLNNKQKIIVECYNTALKIQKNPDKKQKYLFDTRIKLKRLGRTTLLPFALTMLNLFVNKCKTPEDVLEKIYTENDNGNKIINYHLRKYEDKGKEEVIKETIKQNRKDKIYFYVASWHKDSAKDHEYYQGKVYVDEKYPQELESFVISHNIQTIQWVMGKPVYFITRPHCRHYFQAKETDKILQGRYRAPKKKIGDRAFQTPAGRTTETKVELYRERLRILQDMYKKQPHAKLRDMILKTKLLIKKWEEYTKAF